ncbi:MAG: PQQ-binding-like beta-propeller repeat protein, partial [Planctomycetes bacterium]|nr:PQQ-binding-like beta-propeller repeat protein [Planctomycetota bacterium]
QPEQYGPCYMPGALEDILTSDGQYVYLRDLAFNKNAKPQKEVPPHFLTLTGFLDDTWAHRSYWAFGARSSLRTGCSPRDRGLIFGRLLVFNGPMIYGYGRAEVDWSNQLHDRPYRLFAVNRDAKQKQTGGKKRRRAGRPPELWAKSLPIHARAMVLAGKVLFVAGPEVDARTGGQGEGAMLLAVSPDDGKELARYPLDSAPVWDGMAAANGRLYLSLHNGRLVCYGDNNWEPVRKLDRR